MAEGAPRGVWTHRLLYVGLAAGLLVLRLMPLGSVAGGWPGPDLLLCLTLVWVLRRPDYVPALLIGIVVLLEDLLLMRPPGLWAAITVLGAEFLRNRATLTRETGFMVEWLLVAGVMAAAVLGNGLVLGMVMLDEAGMAMTMVQLVASMLCYPVVVAVSQLVFGVRKPAVGEINAWGRRL